MVSSGRIRRKTQPALKLHASVFNVIWPLEYGCAGTGRVITSKLRIPIAYSFLLSSGRKFAGLFFFRCWFSGNANCANLGKNFRKTLYNLQQDLNLMELACRFSSCTSSVFCNTSYDFLGRITWLWWSAVLKKSCISYAWGLHTLFIEGARLSERVLCAVSASCWRLRYHQGWRRLFATWRWSVTQPWCDEWFRAHCKVQWAFKKLSQSVVQSKFSMFSSVSTILIFS